MCAFSERVSVFVSQSSVFSLLPFVFCEDIPTAIHQGFLFSCLAFVLLFGHFCHQSPTVNAGRERKNDWAARKCVHHHQLGVLGLVIVWVLGDPVIPSGDLFFSCFVGDLCVLRRIRRLYQIAIHPMIPTLFFLGRILFFSVVSSVALETRQSILD